MNEQPTPPEKSPKTIWDVFNSIMKALVSAAEKLPHPLMAPILVIIVIAMLVAVTVGLHGTSDMSYTVLIALLAAISSIVILFLVGFGAWSASQNRQETSGNDSKSSNSNALDNWPESYLIDVQQRCGRVNMTAIDPRAQVRGHAELDLQQIFTNLDVEKKSQTDPDDKESSKENQLRQSLLRNKEDFDKHRRQPFLELVSQHEKLVIKGAPGAGKSTFMRYVALCLAGEKLQDKEVNASLLSQHGWTLPAMYPIYVVLRDFAARGIPKKQGLWEFIAAELQNEQLMNCVSPLETQLKEHGGLVLLDGLDEVPEPHNRRQALRDAVKRFARDFPKARIVVTTRPYAYTDKSAWRLPNFAETELLDFSSEQIEEYIERWYAAAAAKDPNLSQSRAQKYQTDLQREVKQNEHLYNLAQRPLLLALMVSLHRSREGGALPQRRIDLYDASVDLLLDLWQRGKIIRDETGHDQGQENNAFTELGIDGPTLRKGLSELAYQAHSQQPNLVGTADITRDQLVLALDRMVPKEKRAMVNKERIAIYIQDRAGLLEDRGEDIYGFPHRTFQEYLAAMHLGAQNDFPTNLITLVRQDIDRWREATLLAGNSIGKQSYQIDMVYKLFDKKLPSERETPTEEAIRGGFLAGQLVWDSELFEHLKGETFADVRDGVRAWQSWIVGQGLLSVSDRAAAGRVLAYLGDPREGVGVKDGLPDIVWGKEVPAGTHTIGSSWEDSVEKVRQEVIKLSYRLARYPITQAQFAAFEQWGDSGEKVRQGVIKQPYRLARYPITQAQFAAFEQAPDWDDKRWWQGLPKGEKRFRPSTFPYANHPRETVSWYQAVAFCRWLSAKLAPTGYEISLPHEVEWEVAARYPHGQDYPWGETWDSANANTGEGKIISTTAVGSYPQGANTALDLYDMSGNIFEWCLNKYDRPDDTTVDQSNDNRVVRGGSWANARVHARAAYRYNYRPSDRYIDIGFRPLLRRAPSQ